MPKHPRRQPIAPNRNAFVPTRAAVRRRHAVASAVISRVPGSDGCTMEKPPYYEYGGCFCTLLGVVFFPEFFGILHPLENELIIPHPKSLRIHLESKVPFVSAFLESDEERF